MTCGHGTHSSGTTLCNTKHVPGRTQEGKEGTIEIVCTVRPPYLPHFLFESTALVSIGYLFVAVLLTFSLHNYCENVENFYFRYIRVVLHYFLRYTLCAIR